MRTIGAFLSVAGIIALAFTYIAFVFLMTFREYDGVWYNCMYAKSENAKTACGVK